jgi:hypothetical protein
LELALFIESKLFAVHVIAIFGDKIIPAYS